MQGKERLPLPAYTRGFLYWKNEDELHSPLAGSLRFRMTRSADPKSFESGRDLPWPSDRDWKIIQAQCREVFQSEKRLKISTSITLFKIKQAFYANRAVPLRLVVIECGGEVGKIQLPTVYDAIPSKGSRYYPCEDACSALLRLEHAGRRVLLLRTIRLLHPLVMNAPTDDIVPFTEGDLVMIRHNAEADAVPGLTDRAETNRPWACDLDRKDDRKLRNTSATAVALRLVSPNEAAVVNYPRPPVFFFAEEVEERFLPGLRVTPTIMKGTSAETWRAVSVARPAASDFPTPLLTRWSRTLMRIYTACSVRSGAPKNDRISPTNDQPVFGLNKQPLPLHSDAYISMTDVRSIVFAALNMPLPKLHAAQAARCLHDVNNQVELGATQVVTQTETYIDVRDIFDEKQNDTDRKGGGNYIGNKKSNDESSVWFSAK
ncbi:hypothetical protein DFH08DRAFT_812070 [Mycena albidolilacea]|uniref:Uncharacterized protein n=1 Tax=Mycena albidolilacea TaxID=1033008 RepID=A0AAD6ZTZ0_9AGAR|nr:hypothetical protein DFH08DRAFT_812070 [Mycena albidolilacea]